MSIELPPRRWRIRVRARSSDPHAEGAQVREGRDGGHGRRDQIHRGVGNEAKPWLTLDKEVTLLHFTPGCFDRLIALFFIKFEIAIQWYKWYNTVPTVFYLLVDKTLKCISCPLALASCEHPLQCYSRLATPTEVQGDPSAGEPGLGWLRFGMFQGWSFGQTFGQLCTLNIFYMGPVPYFIQNVANECPWFCPLFFGTFF